MYGDDEDIRRREEKQRRKEDERYRVETDIKYGMNNSDLELQKHLLSDPQRAEQWATMFDTYKRDELGNLVRNDGLHNGNSSSNRSSSSSYTSSYSGKRYYSAQDLREAFGPSKEEREKSEYSGGDYHEKNWRDIAREAKREKTRQEMEKWRSIDTGYKEMSHWSLGWGLTFCGAAAVAAGIAMFANVPALVTTATFAVAGCLLAIKRDMNTLKGMNKVYAQYKQKNKSSMITDDVIQYVGRGLFSAALVLPTSLAGPVGPMIAGGVAFSTALIMKIVSRERSWDNLG